MQPRSIQNIRWLRISLIAWWFVVWAGACQPSEKEEDNRCEYEGTCKITYTYDSNNKWSTVRTCTLEREKARLCGECWERQNNSDGRPTAKTCLVCNLCKRDFECIADSDCGTARPFCQTGVCVQCRGNGDCSSKDRSYCEANVCVQCRDDRDCSSENAPQCLSGICAGCSCPTGQKCRKDSSGALFCVQCVTSADCKAPTPKCDEKTWTCKPACEKDQDCGEGKRCNEGACVECTSADDCLGDPQKPRCVEGSCGCKDASDCSIALPFCSTEKRCVQCTKDADCASGFPRCLGGECQARPCNNDSQCVAVGYDKCLTFGQRRVCLGCLQDSDCATGQRCDVGLLRCIK